MRGWVSALLLVPVIAATAACGAGSSGGRDDGADDTGSGSASAAARLEQQRDEVRAAARKLLVAAEKRLPGSTRNSVGRWEGCESAFPEGFRDFRYVGQARVDVDGGSSATSPYVEDLRPALEAAGFTVGQPERRSNGFTTLKGAKGQLTASFVHTGGAFVGLDIAGPCVEVPKGDRDAWLRKDEPSPELR